MKVTKCGKMLMPMTIILTMMLSVSEVNGQEVFLPNTRNYVFSHLGKALMTADYGHIAIPINITSAAIYLDLLKNLVMHTKTVQNKMRNHQPNTDNMYGDEKAEVEAAWKVAKSRLRVYSDLMTEDFELASHNFCQLSQFATNHGERICQVNRILKPSKPSSPWTVDAITDYKFPKNMTEFDLFRTDRLPHDDPY